MIRIQKITIHEFRGIRKLSLDFKRASYAICGPNGTGKSGVVDAVEFGLTGNISRLSGEGRGQLSVLKHGPHVDSGTTPEKAVVIIEAFIPSLNKQVVIERNVKNARNVLITPDEPEIREILDRFAQHPEFVLSRREIIKYVLAEPGERAKEVQALLQLNDLETLRVLLQRIANASKKAQEPLEGEESGLRLSLMKFFEIDELTPDKILEVTNQKRITLGLPVLPRLSKTGSLKDGADSLVPVAASRIPKPQALTEIENAMSALSGLVSEETKAELQTALEAVQALQANELDLKALTKASMLETALALFDEHACPVCESELDPQHFRRVVEAQLKRLETTQKARVAAEALFTSLIRKLETARTSLRLVAGYGPLFVPPYDTIRLDECSTQLQKKTSTLRQFLPLAETLAALNWEDCGVEDAVASIQEIKRMVTALPEPSERDAARDFLGTADERLKSYRIAAAKLNIAKKQTVVSRKAFDVFSQATNTALEGIYKQVEAEFKDFYRFLNEDESAFEAKLTPSIGKLGFGVDFYGRGSFPPGAYHSEGHQDAMGLCLYLALMKHILGNGFSLSVLDDVLMSVDTHHRRRVCRLLKKEFPNTQFILTTHDPVWLRYMKTEALIASDAGVEFQNWDVATGPTQWKDIDVWGQIEGKVAKNEVQDAAHSLRFYLEYLAAEYCSELGGRVEYRGDHNYDLGALLPGAISAMKKRLKEAKDAAKSWGDDELLKQVNERESAFSQAVSDALVEQWQVNPLVHYNNWANFTKDEFKVVVAAFKRLTEEFACGKCGGNLYTTRTGYDRDALRCPCPATSFTLRKKE